MGDLFLSILNMSLTASYAILFVMVVRLLLKKAPKFFSYALWIVVAFRLMVPFSFESIYSLLPLNAVSIPHDIIYQQNPQINSGIRYVDTFINDILPAATVEASVNPLQIYIQIGAYVWSLGVMTLLVYSFVSILLLNKRLKNAKLIRQNIYQVDNLITPFVLGLIRPRIYLPVGLSKEEMSYILLHEQTHIRRNDHIIKPLAFLVSSIHWFNPFVWIAFMLMSMDMEFSCDERVLKELDADIKKSYATSLLMLAADRRILNGSPLAFGEGNVKKRIKNVLNYKKPRFWIVAIALIMLVAACVGLSTNPQYILIPNTGVGLAGNVRDQINLEPTSPEVSLEQAVGVDMVELDFASDDIVIFHDYFGLFVYDLNSLQIIRSLDLKPLNCHYTQGDNYCDVSVSIDGSMVQLHPMSSKNMYVYTVTSHALQETTYKPMVDSFRSQLVPIAEVIDSTILGNYSHNAVRFGTSEYGYLRTNDGTLGTLSYVRDDMMYTLFEKEN